MTSRCAPAPTRASPARAPKSCSNRPRSRSTATAFHQSGEAQGLVPHGLAHPGKAHFVVTVPQLRAATIAGSGDIKVDQVTGDLFEGTVAGSGGMPLASTEVQLAEALDRRLGRGQARCRQRARAPNMTSPARAGSTPPGSAPSRPRSRSPDRAASRPRPRAPPSRHHGLGRRHRQRRRQMLGQQSRVGQRALLLNLS